MPVKLGNVFIDHVFLVSPQLLTSAILGVGFFINTSAIIKFPERHALFEVDNETTRLLFNVTEDDLAKISGNSESGNAKLGCVPCVGPFT